MKDIFKNKIVLDLKGYLPVSAYKVASYRVFLIFADLLAFLLPIISLTFSEEDQYKSP